MSDTDSESSYIREVTKYFCDLAGRAPMISSEDEHLLMKWRRDGISKQDVLTGIKKAFEGGGVKRMRISSCSRFVEERAGGSPSVAPGGQAERAGVHSVLSAVSVNMTNVLAQTRDPKIAECLKAAHKTFSQSAPEAPDVWDLLKQTRRQMCEDLIAVFEPSRRERILSAARETVFSPGRKFINEGEERKVLTACVDDLVMREAGFEGMFSLSGEESDG
ncbi:MAG: hypothetical protein OXF52_01625 [Candidatus Dadabacteria bacterium]|nr:hypothetical protein [Candidatus Dadabacteria bacterium]